MSELRTRLIRLAAAKPELRADLLPLLKEESDPASHDQNKPESYYGLPPRGVQASIGTPSLADLEAAIIKARRDVLSDNEVIADAASIEIKRLQNLIRNHPDEVSRRDRIEQAKSERMLRMWE